MSQGGRSEWIRRWRMARAASSERHAAWPIEPWTLQLLADLSTGGYRPAAWVRFFAASWRRAHATAHDQPSIAAGWRHLSVAVLVGSATLLAVAWQRRGVRAARHLGTNLLAGVLLQQADAFVHLGMNRRLQDGQWLPALGTATWLSYLRGTSAHWLLAATRADVDIPGLVPGVLVLGALTDALDGPLARHLGQATKLGAYADGEADLVLALALTLAAVRRGALPASARWLPAARYALPIGVAFGRAFVGGRPPALEHTRLGRLCGVAQAGLLGCSLAPRRLRPPEGVVRMLLVITAVLSTASGVAQALRMASPGRAYASPRR